MAVLTMDTATLVAATAVADGAGSVLASATSWVPRGHSRILQPQIQSVLQTAGVAPGELTEIVVGVGPGSYTGVRLAVSTAKAMAAALNLALVPVSTLLAMAETAAPTNAASETTAVVMPLLYARRGRAFGAIYQSAGGRWETRVEAQVLSVAEWIQRAEVLIAAGSSMTVVHDFEPRHKVLDALPSHSAWNYLRLADAAGGLGPALARLARFQGLPRVTGLDVHTVIPDYALPVEAEVKLAERSQQA